MKNNKKTNVGKQHLVKTDLTLHLRHTLWTTLIPDSSHCCLQIHSVSLLQQLPNSNLARPTYPTVH